MPRFNQVTTTIRAGESLSAVVDCSAGAPVMLHMPDQWTPARISFQVSTDGQNFNDLFDQGDREIQFNIRANASVLLDTGWAPVVYVKLRSGGRDLPVRQDADRQIIITIDTSTRT